MARNAMWGNTLNLECTKLIDMSAFLGITDIE